MDTQKAIRDFRILRNIRLNPRHFILELLAPEKLPEILPGQFVQVLIGNYPSSFLRRPFSIHSVNFEENSIRLLIQIKGENTRHLSLYQSGEKLNLIYPLGNSFSIPTSEDVLLAGGGCGMAPLLFLARQLHQNGCRCTILTGWKSSKDIFELDEYRRFGDVYITTEDGSEGEKGLVTDHSILKHPDKEYRMIYCCGPEAMMKAVAGIANKNNTPCEVSLENTMACGFGVCLCCVTPTLHGNQRVCVEGPVFNTKELNW
jgi:dihydroorotate dehydrogenase electron transfer subunit